MPALNLLLPTHRRLRLCVPAAAASCPQGEDAFSSLGDRQDLPPLPLPALTQPKRVVLVRHGQSTWNARNRIQVRVEWVVGVGGSWGGRHVGTSAPLPCPVAC